MKKLPHSLSQLATERAEAQESNAGRAIEILKWLMGTNSEKGPEKRNF